MNKKELSDIIEKHEKWLNGKDGQRANLQRANLQDANLQDANLRDANLQRANLQDANLLGANLQDANLQDANLQGADLRGANLQGADLKGVDLQGVDLQGANLKGVDLDFSCFPMWCGGSRFKVDSRIVRQMLAHIVTLGVEDADDGLKSVLESIRPEAEKSHRASDLGL